MKIIEILKDVPVGQLDLYYAPMGDCVYYGTDEDENILIRKESTNIEDIASYHLSKDLTDVNLVLAPGKGLSWKDFKVFKPVVYSTMWTDTYFIPLNTQWSKTSVEFISGIYIQKQEYYLTLLSVQDILNEASIAVTKEVLSVISEDLKATNVEEVLQSLMAKFPNKEHKNDIFIMDQTLVENLIYKPQNNTLKPVVEVERITKWTDVLNAARFTVHKEFLNTEPTATFKRKMVCSEHSPLRLLEYRVIIRDAKRWVVDHLTRHHVGIIPYVATQRTDRYEKVKTMNRDNMSQGMATDVMFVINAQAIINISKVRLCNNASLETRTLWAQVLKEINKLDPELYNACVPSCIYRGFCPELNCCGYTLTEKYQKERQSYQDQYCK